MATSAENKDEILRTIRSDRSGDIAVNLHSILGQFALLGHYIFTVVELKE